MAIKSLIKFSNWWNFPRYTRNNTQIFLSLANILFRLRERNPSLILIHSAWKSHFPKSLFSIIAFPQKSLSLSLSFTIHPFDTHLSDHFPFSSSSSSSSFPRFHSLERRGTRYNTKLAFGLGIVPRAYLASYIDE